MRYQQESPLIKVAHEAENIHRARICWAGIFSILTTF